jgi:cytochrome c biogenesis factor
LQNDWTTEVAVESTWRGDFYTVLHAGLGKGRVLVTLVDNPMICWIWIGGAVATAAAIVALWPASRGRAASAFAGFRPVVATQTVEQDDSGASAA